MFQFILDSTSDLSFRADGGGDLSWVLLHDGLPLHSGYAPILMIQWILVC